MFDPHSLALLKEGDKVFAVGFGYFQELSRASIYAGYVTRIVRDASGQ